MKTLLNTLYVVTPGCRLSKDGDCVKVMKDGGESNLFPVNILENIVCFTYAGPSTQMIDLCSKSGIPLTIMSPTGRFIATMQGPIRGNVLLRRTQYRCADDSAFCLSFSKNIIWGKLFNSIKMLQRGLKDHRDEIDSESVERVIAHIKEALDSISDVDSMEVLRGLEGDSAKQYFDAIDKLILKNKDVFKMTCRNRRPPLDPMNALLSFLYSMLTNEVKSSLEATGLDPYVGYMHTDRPGRPSLALDMMEELRSPMADRLALKTINLGRIRPGDFHTDENGACYLTSEGRDKVLTFWQEEKKATVMHGYISEVVEWGLVPHVQASLLSRHLRSDIQGYPPFLI